MEKYKKKELSILGGTPTFKEPLPVGQFYFPEFHRYEAALRDIFNRRHYVSQRHQAPLTKELERKLCGFFNVKNVICVSNATLGLIMVASAMGLSGKVVMPSWTFIGTAQSLLWNRLEPVFCDINPDTQHIDANYLDNIFSTHNISAVLGVNLWGGASDVGRIIELGRKNGVPVYFDSAQAFGCEINGKPLGGFGAAEVFSFHATKIFSAAEGGAITTDDDELADKLRSMFYYDYKSKTDIKYQKSFTARISEIQAAVALMSLEDFSNNRSKNQKQHAMFGQLLSEIPGIRVNHPSGVSRSNYQYLVVSVDPFAFGLSRDELWSVLRAENVLAKKYFNPAVHRVDLFSTRRVEEWDRKLPNTVEASKVTLQLPLGAMVELVDIEKIVNIISLAHSQRHQIRTVLEKQR